MDLKRVVRQPRGPPLEVEGQRNWRSSSETTMNEQSSCPVDENLNTLGSAEVRRSSISSAYGAESPVSDISFAEDLFGPSEELVYVTHVQSPSMFWAQLADDETQEQINQLSEQLQIFCGNRPLLQGIPILKKIYGGVYDKDGCWYRCKILENLNENKVKVLFLDFGNEQIICQNQLVSLSRELYSESSKAKLYKLNGVDDPTNPDSELFIKGVEKLTALVADKNLTAKRDGVCKPLSSAYPVDVVFSQDKELWNLNQLMIEAGFSMLPEVLEEKPLTPKQTTKPEPVAPRRPAVINNSPMGKAFISNSENTMPKKPKDNQDLKLQELEASIKNKDRTIETLKQMCSQLEKSKKLEIEDKERRFKEQLEESDNQLNRAVSTKVEQLLSKVHSLRKIRKESKDSRNSALKTIQDSLHLLKEQKNIEPENMEELTKVKEVEKLHSDLQDKIRECTDKDKLPGLVEQRNTSRQDLNQAVTAFTSCVENLQLDLAKVKLEVALSSLSLNVGDNSKVAVSLPSTANLAVLEEYKMFQAKKEKDLKEMNTLVNEKCSILIDVYSNIIKVLNLNEEIDATQSCPAGVAELDDTMGVLEALIQEEIAKSKCSEEEESLRNKAVETLIHELQELLTSIQELKKKIEYYNKLQESIKQSIHTKLDVAQGKDIKRRIKKQTMLLKRKLLDEAELKENEDATQEEILKLTEELNTLYFDLHQAFVEEDTFINNLAKLSKQDFPELLLQYPELGLSQCLETNGLVKSDRTLEQYPLEELEAGFFASSFCGKKCLIKEYFFRDAAAKSLFQKKAVEFHDCVSEQVISPVAVFYNKNGRIGYIQVPYYEPLEQWRKTEPHQELKKKIMKEVIEGLAQLHSQNIVHGSIDNKAIFISSCDGEPPRGLLGPYDFSEDLDSRVLQTARILNLAKEDSQSTPKFDLICLGYLMASLTIPDWKSSSDLNQLTKDAALLSLLEGLLSNGENSLLTAEDALSMTYFEESLVQNGHISPVDEELD